jgi:hypothetical protein
MSTWASEQQSITKTGDQESIMANQIIKETPVNEVAELCFDQTFVLWTHDNGKDWSIYSYKKICDIRTVNKFWQIINNIEQLGFPQNHFFLMKRDIDPTWEHPRNRDGGVCSLRIEKKNVKDLWECLCAMLVTKEISSDMDDIVGVSVSPRNEWCICKIWNSDKKKSLIDCLNKTLIQKYADLSIQYKANAPEY